MKFHKLYNQQMKKFSIEIMRNTEMNIIKIKKIKIKMKIIIIKSKWLNKKLNNYNRFKRLKAKILNMDIFRKETMIFLETIKMQIRVKDMPKIDNNRK
jgi:hypothetical protein